MFTVVPFMPIHLEGVVLHQYMGEWQDYLEDPEYANILMTGPAYTGIANGKVIICSGVVKVGLHRYAAWALLSEDSKDYMLQITRAVKDFLKENDMPRVETHVLRDFDQGHRWAKMLGFENETPNGMRKYGDNGKTYDLYARIT